VLLVHGYNSGPQTWNADTRSTYASVSGVCIDVFDYKNWSTHWVTDSHIGPALAMRIDELASASSSGGGSGKVIIVAHSMGGLATRCALAESCNGGISGVAVICES
jgi:predicted alpha/beta hydrolase family esterase